MSRFLDYINFTSGVTPLSPFLPQTPHPESMEVILSGALTGDTAYFEPYNAKIHVIANDSNIIKSITVLENNQEFWNSASLPIGNYRIEFISDNFSTFLPSSYTDVIITQAGTYPNYPAAFTVNL
jgi:hypothetical protein